MNPVKIFIYVVALLFPTTFVGCTNSVEERDEIGMNRSIYVDEFKLTYFRKMLLKTYNNSGAAREIINQDHSGFTEIVLTMDDYNLLDSLTSADNEFLKSDSAYSIGRRAEGAEGKQSLGLILDRISSHWLDSLALRRFEISNANTSMFYD
ncbi:hypothetical protein LXM26_30120 [Dyadobacter sp. LJ419]|uniref:Uncharacterized protein n=2 Tax=Dyadobacter chenwenxiniae TaxID=2906456 RepID=A0A9X1PUF1_9BACT|nr:hypothetical protein [Dyadobacter chenwenxiniae]MCF0065808.1 hypothetical protein [Dyadobacter chenwenxiniae]